MVERLFPPSVNRSSAQNCSEWSNSGGLFSGSLPHLLPAQSSPSIRPGAAKTKFCCARGAFPRLVSGAYGPSGPGATKTVVAAPWVQ